LVGAPLTKKSSVPSKSEVYTLHTSGYVNNWEREKQHVPGRRPPQPKMTTIGGPGKPVRVQVDSLGNVLEYAADLPSTLLGPMALMIFEPLSADGQTQWTTHHENSLEIVSGEDPRGRDNVPFALGGYGPSGFGRSFGPRGPMGSRYGRSEPASPKTKNVPAAEDVSYSLRASGGDSVTIHKKYDWKTNDPSGQTAAYHVTGEGDMAFDMKAGLPQKMEFKGELTLTKGNVSARYPLTMTYKLTDEKAALAASGGSSSRTSSRPPAEGPFVPVARQPGRLAVRASGIEGQKTPDLAFDGDPQTAWAAGDWAVQWIEADLMQPTPLKAIRLIAGQQPASDTVHEVWLSDKPLGNARTGGKLLHTFRGFTKEYDELKFSLPPGTTARYVQIRTMESASWVAWPEIDIQRGE
jgi:hypothetical protein